MKGQEEQDYTRNKKALKKVEASSREHGDAMEERSRARAPRAVCAS